MSKTHTITLRVKFAGYNPKIYDYLYDLEEGGVPPAEGDIAIVKPSSNYEVVTIVEFLDQATPQATKYAFGFISMAAHKAREYRVARRKKIVAELKKIETEVHESFRYNYLASMSPKAAGLIRELETIGA